MNPITIIPKLTRSKPRLDALEKEFITMTKRNWKTNTLGAIALIVGLAQIWAPASLQPEVQMTIGVLTSVGLLAAKDHDK